jgi:hypothetical protein
MSAAETFKKKKVWTLLLLVSLSLIALWSCLPELALSDMLAKDSTPLKIVTSETVWERVLGGNGDDRAFFALSRDTDKYLVLGSSTSFAEGVTVAWVVQIGPEGNVEWNRTYPWKNGTEFRYVLSLNDGFLLVGNVFLPSGDWDGWVVRTDDDGNALWNTSLGGDRVDRLFSATDAGDGFVLCGLTLSFGEGGSDMWAAKVDVNGISVWNKTYGQSGEEGGRAILRTDNDHYLLAGYTNSFGNGQYDFWLCKIDGMGTPIWNHTYGRAESDQAYAIVRAEEGYLIAGETHSQSESDADALVVRIDTEGGFLWEQTYGGEEYDVATSMIRSADGNYLVSGYTFSFSAGQRDFWLFKINDSGGILWSTTQGRTEFEEAYCVLEENDEEYVMAGWTNSIGHGLYDYYVVKIKVNSDASTDVSRFALVIMASGTLLVAVFLSIGVYLYRKKSRLQVSQT